MVVSYVETGVVDFTKTYRDHSQLKAFIEMLIYRRASFVSFSKHEDSDTWLDGLWSSLPIVVAELPNSFLQDLWRHHSGA
jgi:transposase